MVDFNTYSERVEEATAILKEIVNIAKAHDEHAVFGDIQSLDTLLYGFKVKGTIFTVEFHPHELAVEDPEDLMSWVPGNLVDGEIVWGN